MTPDVSGIDRSDCTVALTQVSILLRLCPQLANKVLRPDEPPVGLDSPSMNRPISNRSINPPKPITTGPIEFTPFKHLKV